MTRMHHALAAALILVSASACTALFSTPPSPAVAIAVAESARHNGVASLQAMLASGDAAKRASLMMPLARTFAPKATKLLLEGLEDKSWHVRQAAALGLAVHAADNTEQALLQRFAVEPREEVQLAIWTALGRLATEAAMQAAPAALAAGRAPLKAAVALALGLMGRRGIALDARAKQSLVPLCAHQDQAVRYAAFYALARAHEPAADPEVSRALRAGLADEEPEIRSLAVFAIAHREAPSTFTKIFVQTLNDKDWRVRVQALRALGQGTMAATTRVAVAQWAAAQWKLLADAQADVEQADVAGAWHPWLLALTMLQHHGDAPEVRALWDAVLSRRAALKPVPVSIAGGLATAECLAQAGLVRHEERGLRKFLSCGGPAWPMHMRAPLAAEMLASGLVDKEAERLVIFQELAADSDPRIRGIALGAALDSDDPVLRGQAETIALTALAKEKSPIVVGAIAEVYASEEAAAPKSMRSALVARARAEAHGDPELRILLMDVLSTLGAREARPVFEAALGDANIGVRQAATRLWKALYDDQARPSPVKLPAPSHFNPESGEQIAKVIDAQPRLIVETSKGTFSVLLDGPTAPFAVASTARLAEQGFYNQTIWHRVVPDFVVQGGDPGGSGWGGPGYTLPAEPTMKPFERGMVGLADAGLDTAGCQWFVMHSRAPHLEGRYTIIGKVEEGMAVVDALLPGDRILSTKVQWPVSP